MKTALGTLIIVIHNTYHDYMDILTVACCHFYAEFMDLRDIIGESQWRLVSQEIINNMQHYLRRSDAHLALPSYSNYVSMNSDLLGGSYQNDTGISRCSFVGASP